MNLSSYYWYFQSVVPPRICDMIVPGKTTFDSNIKWHNQIVANKLCDIDVDKIDYIMRDSYHLGIKCGGEYTFCIFPFIFFRLFCSFFFLPYLNSLKKKSIFLYY